MRLRNLPARYDHVAVVLHWTIAVLMISAIIAGEVMPKTGMRGFLYSSHASLGISVLALSILRLFWRLSQKFPEYPVTIPVWQRIIARSVSIAFYILMIAIPLTGWLAHSLDAVSRPFFINSRIFGTIAVPILPVDHPGISAFLRSLELNNIHEFASNLMIGLVILHVGAALKHQILDRDDVMIRMLPDFRRNKTTAHDAR